MNLEQAVKIIQLPYVSEKSVRLGEKNNQVVFRVAPEATKPDIKRAVEKLFKVAVIGVTVLNVKPKVKRVRQKLGKRSGWKKAYVRLAEGNDIDFTQSI